MWNIIIKWDLQWHYMNGSQAGATYQSTLSPSLGLIILKMALHDPGDQHFSNFNVSANHVRIC